MDLWKVLQAKNKTKLLEEVLKRYQHLQNNFMMSYVTPCILCGKIETHCFSLITFHSWKINSLFDKLIIMK